MVIIDELTQSEIESPDLSAGELSSPTMWAAPEAYATIDNIMKFALDDSDYEEVQIYHRWTTEEIAQQQESAAQAARQDVINGLPEVVAANAAEQEAYAADTDAALFDLDAAQTAYETDTDAALFDLVDYIAALEGRIAALEVSNG